jgi:hypothetical protein
MERPLILRRNCTVQRIAVGREMILAAKVIGELKRKIKRHYITSVVIQYSRAGLICQMSKRLLSKRLRPGVGAGTPLTALRGGLEADPGAGLFAPDYSHRTIRN